jgi:hypothetical protein
LRASVDVIDGPNTTNTNSRRCFGPKQVNQIGLRSSVDVTVDVTEASGTIGTLRAELLDPKTIGDRRQPSRCGIW